jgi:hypothetical protein
MLRRVTLFLKEPLAFQVAQKLSPIVLNFQDDLPGGSSRSIVPALPLPVQQVRIASFSYLYRIGAIAAAETNPTVCPHSEYFPTRVYLFALPKSAGIVAAASNRGVIRRRPTGDYLRAPERTRALTHFEIAVYHLKDGRLHRILAQGFPNKHYLALEATDADGDERAELVANTAASGNRTRWTVWRYANGTLTEQSGEHRTDLKRVRLRK